MTGVVVLLQVLLFGRPAYHRDSDWKQLINVSSILKSTLLSADGQAWLEGLAARPAAGVIPVYCSCYHALPLQPGSSFLHVKRMQIGARLPLPCMVLLYLRKKQMTQNSSTGRRAELGPKGGTPWTKLMYHTKKVQPVPLHAYATSVSKASQAHAFGCSRRQPSSCNHLSP